MSTLTTSEFLPFLFLIGVAFGLELFFGADLFLVALVVGFLRILRKENEIIP
jgi:hypothetical protein